MRAVGVYLEMRHRICGRGSTSMEGSIQVGQGCKIDVIGGYPCQDGRDNLIFIARASNVRALMVLTDAMSFSLVVCLVSEVFKFHGTTLDGTDNGVRDGS